MTELEASGVGENPPPYIIFVVVFLFFLTGLFGFLICHLLKKKGYHCRTGDIDDEEEEEEEEEEEKKLGVNADDGDDENQDTVEQILKCIIENEANMEAFNEMLGNHNVCVRHDPRLRKESIGGVPPHHHTVHSGTDHNSCHLCAQIRSKKGRRQSRTPRSKQRPGEQTVFSVGRFRVTHTDKKLHAGPNPMVSSGDLLDQSHDSEEQKEGGYNLRSMFQDVHPPSEGSNGITPNVGKRRKSLNIFGLRRGSDPVGLKVGEGTGRETGGVRFAIQQQPVVQEELLQAQNFQVADDVKPGILPASPQREAKTSGSVISSSFPSKNQAHESSCAHEDHSKHGLGPEAHTHLQIKASTGSTAASAPSSLPIPPADLSGQTLNTMEKQGDVENKVIDSEETSDPGPLQTSTPIAPMLGSIPVFTPVIPTDQPESCSSTGFPVTQTPPDPSTSPDLERNLGASLALMSLGSSPPSSVSLLKTPTSPLPVTPSPKLSSRSTPSEARTAAFSPALPPSPKLQSGQASPSQSTIPSLSFGKSASPLQGRTPSPLTATPKLQTPSSPADPNLGLSSHLTLKSGSVTPVTSVTKGDMVSRPLPLTEQELEEGAKIPKTEEKMEIKRGGILKTAKLSPFEKDWNASTLFSPTDQLSKDRLNTFPPSPSSPLSPSSPVGSRISSVTVIKASPDSKREFSIVTMVEEEEPSTSITDQKGETSEHGVESAVAQVGQAFVSGVEQPESRSGATSEGEVWPTVSQERDDMVEMEDIRDCKVMQVVETKRLEEE